MKRLGLTLLGLAALLSAAAMAAPGPRTHRLASPPANCAQVKHKGHVDLAGELYLTAHDDTLRLVPYGFHRFEFLGWSLSRARYAALWPADVPLDELPAELSEIDYKRMDSGESPPDGETALLDAYDEQTALEDAYEILEPAHAPSVVRTIRYDNGHGVYRETVRIVKPDYERQLEDARIQCAARSYRRVRHTYDYAPWEDYSYYYGGGSPYRRSRGRSYGDPSYETGVPSFGFGRRTCSDGTTQPVLCGSSTTLERTPIQNQYYDWQRSRSPFMSNPDGGIGVGYRCR
jgi:hypothetical protein